MPHIVSSGLLLKGFTFTLHCFHLPMTLILLGFGIVKDIFGDTAISIDVGEQLQVADLKHLLRERYPRLRQLSSFMVAVNNQYAADNQSILPADEIAIIPPVSGG